MLLLYIDNLRVVLTLATVLRRSEKQKFLPEYISQDLTRLPSRYLITDGHLTRDPLAYRESTVF